MTKNYFLLVKEKNFLYFFIATLIGVLGEGMFGLTSIVLILSKTGSAFEVGKMFVLTLFPSVILAPFAGVLIDRYDKRKIAVLCNLVRLIAILIIPVSFYAGVFTISIFSISIFFSYIAWYILEPTKESILKSILDKDHYQQGIALVQGAWQVGLLASAVIAGIVIDWIGVEFSILISGMTYLPAAIFFLLIKRPQIPLTVEQESHPFSLKKYTNVFWEGWTYFLQNKKAKFFILTTSVTLPYFYGINVLIAPFNHHVLNGTGTTLGLIDSGAGIGSLLSAMICTFLAAKMNSQKYLFASIILLGVSTVLFSLTNSVLVAFFTYIIIGFFIGNVKVLSRTLVFDFVEEKFIGRVMTTVSLLSLAQAIIMSLLVSYLADKSILFSYITISFLLIFPLLYTIMGIKAAKEAARYDQSSRKEHFFRGKTI
ncbi:MFS transporter [Bacillus sp. FJAT-29814]|uniref:MFS transporter n=1 Tax=Bacillus sp. FJAT-29814 TaxID=1729688 RepID=UPI00082D0658|nr:MFS transporter [Bacillus sp. FJAT-29814]